MRSVLVLILSLMTGCGAVAVKEVPSKPTLLVPAPSTNRSASILNARSATVSVRCMVSETKMSAGSGVIVKGKNATYVWTAYHVIKDRKKDIDIVYVPSFWYGDQRSISSKGEVVAFDEKLDLAILKVDKPDLYQYGVIFKFGKQPPSGDKVFHVSHFSASTPNIVNGIVSRYKLSKDVLLVETTAITSQGASGGGVFLEDGICIGIVISYRIKPQGIGVAVSSLHLFRFAKDNNLIDAYQMSR